MSIRNPSDSKVSLFKVSSEFIDEVYSTNTNAPKVTFESDIDYVQDLTVTIISTRDKKVPSRPVQLSILACVQDSSLFTKGVIETNGKLVSFLHA